MGVIQIFGGDRDGNILDLRDQATKTFYHCPLGRCRIFVCTEKFHPLSCLYPSKSLRCKPYVYIVKSEKRHVCI